LKKGNSEKVNPRVYRMFWWFLGWLAVLIYFEVVIVDVSKMWLVVLSLMVVVRIFLIYREPSETAPDEETDPNDYYLR